MNQSPAYTPEYREAVVQCIICGDPLTVRLARGRKSGKPFVMLLCGRAGHHFRAFVNDQAYVRQVLERLEGKP